MDISPLRYFYRIKRYWKRRRYQKLKNATRIKRKLKIKRLGSRKPRNLTFIKKAPQLGFTFVSPLKLVEKIHEAYVDAMMRLAGEKRTASFEEKRVPKGRPNPLLLSGHSNEIVDSGMVFEIYKRLKSLHDQSAVVLVI